MPELPEVEFARQGLVRWLVGRRIQHIAVAPSRLLRDQPPETLDALKGCQALSVERHGKWLLTTFDSGAGLLWHLGMTGKLVCTEGDAARRWAHVRFGLDDGRLLQFVDPRQLGRLVPGPVDGLRTFASWRTLGPDAWLEPLDGRTLASRAGRTLRPIKVVLMDQTVLAGLGNIQATEALFLAGLHPEQPAKNISSEAWTRLADGIHQTLARTLALNDGEELIYVGEGGGNPFLVYARAGQPCPTCETRLTSLAIGGRTSVLCPRCQPE